MVRYVKTTRGELNQNSRDDTALFEETQNSKLSRVLSHVKRVSDLVLKRPALVASLTVTTLFVGVRHIGFLEPLELNAFDRMMQLRPALPPDPRLLVVEVTEADIQSLGQWPMTDAVMNQLLGNLEQHQPAVIGLDIYRDIPVPPGHEELSTRLQQSDRIIPICQISDDQHPGTPPPPGVPESRVGFADLAIDTGGTVRRALLFHHLELTSGCTTNFSFSFQLARQYLQKKGIQPETISKDGYDQLKLGPAIFKPLLPTSGGYQKADAGGYQILLNYRSPDSLSESLTLTEVLNNPIDPSLVKDRIVLIGTTAPSLKDTFYTPYSTQGIRLQKMPGVVVHGHIVSQILSSVLDGRPLFWFWPEWAEVAWIGVWSLAGGLLVRVTRNPVQLVLAESLAISLLVGTSIVLFLGSGWIPVATPTLGLIVSATGVLTYSAYQTQQERARMTQLVQQQEHNIELLQALLNERTTNPPTMATGTAVTAQTGMPPDESTAIWDPEDPPPNGTKSAVQSESPNLLSGRYHINRILGSGGFGLTYLAEDTLRPGRPKCVVKHLKPARRDEKFLGVARRLFRTEAEILEKLGKHPQIPQLLAYFEENTEFYLVEEYVQGIPLNEELPVDKRLPEEQVVELLKGILEVLNFIHQHGVIHRDIKPSNIIRRQLDNQVVLIDFGAVKQMQPQDQIDQESYTVAVGTRGYAPSEQYAGHPSFGSDIYAVGMIGIQALTGIPPHQLPFSQETGNLSWRNLAHVSEEFAQILDQMVRYHFAERYQSIPVVLEELNKL